MDNHRTLVITTGGTIEAMYNPEEGTPHYVPVPTSAEDTCIPAALKKMGLADNVDFYPLAMKDSKEVTTSMLEHILWKVASEGYSSIVIVHGTDTMPAHARYLKRRIADYGDEYGMQAKSFIFTGSMGPLRGRDGVWREPHIFKTLNDGWTNLDCALKDVHGVKPGVYLEMGHGPKEADTIRKYVEVDQPGNRAATVTHSGFVDDNPSRHIQEIF